jgi:two-component system OmpR family response regulator
MPVSALSPRTNRHVTGPGRGVPRRAGDPALTVTVAIPLSGEALLPQAHKLIEAVRELVELSQGTVTLEQAPPAREEFVPSGSELRLMVASRQVLLDGEALPLTRLEFDLLLYLVERPRHVFTRGQLLAAVWGYEHTGARTVDVHVRRLRLKFGGTLPLITTVYGVGYRLSDDARVTVLPHD